MSTESILYIEHSQVHQKNRQVISLAILVLAAMLAFSLYKWLGRGSFQPLDMFVYLMLIFVLFERSNARYTLELGTEKIRVRKEGICGIKYYEIPYQDIIGIYSYKAKLVNPIKFRRSYRLNSALDNRKVWVLAYIAKASGGKSENRRAYFKASNELLGMLAQQIPNKVKVKEEQVAVDMLKIN